MLAELGVVDFDLSKIFVEEGGGRWVLYYHDIFPTTLDRGARWWVLDYQFLFPTALERVNLRQLMSVTDR